MAARGASLASPKATSAGRPGMVPGRGGRPFPMSTQHDDPARKDILARSRPTTDQARTDRHVARILEERDTSDAARWHEKEWSEKQLLSCVASLLPVDERTLVGASPFPHDRPEAERRQRALRVLYVHRLLSDPDHAHEGEPYDGRDGARVQESRQWQRGLLRFGDAAYERRWYELVREAAAELGSEPAPAGLAKAKGKLTHLELAQRFGLDAEPARKRLDRWRERNMDGWAEVTDRRRGEPKYVYDLAAVARVFADSELGK